jgi:hypothetical protein
MFTTWLTLRQLGEALQQGRLDDAWKLAAQPAVRGHQRAGELLKELGIALARRAQVYVQGKDLDAAWRDVQRAEEVGLDGKTAARLKQVLIDNGVKEVRSALDAGQPQRAIELLDDLRRRGPLAGQLPVLDEVARAWVVAQELAARGDIGQALAKIDAVPWRPFTGLVQYHALLTERQQTFQAMLADLYTALERRQWREVIRLADGLLVVAPQHGEVRRARGRAWRELEPSTQAYVAPAKPAPAAAPTPAPAPPASADAPAAPAAPGGLPRRVILWVDGVGGFLVCLQPRVSLGQATSDSYVDLPLFADISRLHGYLTRDAEGYMLEALRPVTVNGKPSEKALLHDGDSLGLGAHCKLRFRQPVSISTTAKLTVTSDHRMPLALDGILLMAETCVLGDTPDAHIEVPGLRKPVILVRRKDDFVVQTAGAFEVDGKPCRDRAPMTLQSTMTCDEFRLTLEPVGPQFGKRHEAVGNRQ